jgi:muconolactone delta-isomerase
MDYLVTMTTHVPEGTPEEAVEDVRARESAHSRGLAAQGCLLRLWRPPLRPGEWRSIGLFAADDAGQLEAVLASMPLRIWRTDEVTPLSAHPDDPGLPPVKGDTEFLTTFTLNVPAGEARWPDLARGGHLQRLWALPGEERALGLWRAGDAAETQALLKSLRLDAWMTVETTPLNPHPGDPALA